MFFLNSLCTVILHRNHEYNHELFLRTFALIHNTIIMKKYIREKGGWMVFIEQFKQQYKLPALKN